MQRTTTHRLPRTTAGATLLPLMIAVAFATSSGCGVLSDQGSEKATTTQSGSDIEVVGARPWVVLGTSPRVTRNDTDRVTAISGNGKSVQTECWLDKDCQGNKVCVPTTPDESEGQHGLVLGKCVTLGQVPVGGPCTEYSTGNYEGGIFGGRKQSVCEYGSSCQALDNVYYRVVVPDYFMHEVAPGLQWPYRRCVPNDPPEPIGPAYCTTQKVWTTAQLTEAFDNIAVRALGVRFRGLDLTRARNPRAMPDLEHGVDSISQIYVGLLTGLDVAEVQFVHGAPTNTVYVATRQSDGDHFEKDQFEAVVVRELGLYEPNADGSCDVEQDSGSAWDDDWTDWTK